MSDQRAFVARDVERVHFSVLAAALPDARPFTDVEHTLRREFLSWALAPRRQSFTCWQEAWNSWTGAAPHRPGAVRLWLRCPQCHGRLYVIRHGQITACLTCVGRRTVTRTYTALWQPPDRPAP